MRTRLLLRRQVRYLLRAPGATAAGICATALGVASIVAVHLVSELIVSRLQQSLLLSGHTHVVRSPSEESYFELRERWRRGLAPEVRAMTPVLEGHAAVHGQPARLVGIDWLATDRTGGGFGPAQGAAFELLAGDAALASRGMRVASADVVRLGAGPAAAELRIAGVFDGEERSLVMDIAAAQAALQRRNPSAIWIHAPDAMRFRALDRWLPGASAALNLSTTMDFGGGVTAEALDQTQPARRFALALMFNLSALGCLALFVAAFLIYQSSYASVARRARDGDRLLAIGVSRGQLRALFIGEGALLGAIGAGLGCVLGWALAGMLADSPLWAETPLALTGTAAIKGAVAGIGVGAFGAIAASQPPRPRRARWLFPAFAGALLAASVPSNSLAAAFGIILALCIGQIALVTPGAAALANRWRQADRAIPRHRQPPPTAIRRRASRRSFAKQLREVGVAVSALSIAIAAAMGIDAMVESFRRDFAALLDRFYFDALRIELAAPQQVDDQAMRWLRALPDVASARRYGNAEVLLNGHPALVRIGPDDALEASRYGRAEALDDAVLLSEGGARRLAVVGGDRVSIDGGGGERLATIAGLFSDYGAVKPRIAASAQPWAAALGGATFNEATVAPHSTGPGAAHRRAALAETIRARFPRAQVEDHAQIRARALGAFDRSHELSSRLSLLALGVAVAGLYAALSALHARRRGERLLLYTLGVGRWSIGRLALAESLGLGAAAAALAAPLGVAIAWVLCELVNPRAFGWSISFHIPLASVFWPVLLGVGAALLAGLLPALRSMRALASPARYALE